MPRSRRCWCVGWTILVSFSFVCTAHAGAQGISYFDASARHLERTVNPQRDGSHLRRLLALRQLRDPALQPLFEALTRHDEWQVQVHAVLGLAEIDGKLDPFRVTQVGGAAQEAIVANAIDMELLGEAEIETLLAWDELHDMSRALLLAEIELRDGTPDRSALETLARRPDDRPAALASALLANLGDDAAFSAFRPRLDRRAAREREQLTLWMLEAIRQYKLESMLPWVVELLDTDTAGDDVGHWALLTALSLDPDRGIPLWRSRLGADPGYRTKVRFGVLLLAADAGVPAATYDAIDDEHPLLSSIARSGRMIAGGHDASSALIELVDLGHATTAGWVLDTMSRRPDAEAVAVYSHMISIASRSGVDQADRVVRAIEATTRMFERDQEAVFALLRATEDDSLQQEVLLLGLLGTNDARAGEAAAALPRIGAGRADALTLVLMARHAETLSDDDIGKIGRTAAGGGRVSENLQVHAAWLYLKHTNSIDQALDRVLRTLRSDAGSPQPRTSARGPASPWTLARTQEG